MKKAFYAILLGWGLFWISILNPLVEPNYSIISTDFVFYLIGSYIFFSLGVLIFSRPIALPYVSLNPRSMINMILIVLFLAVIFRLTDRLFIRQVSDLFSIMSVRESRAVGSNMFSIMGGVFSILGVVGYSFVKENSLLESKVLRYSFMLFLSLIVLDVFISGSRGILLVILIVVASSNIKIKHLILIVPILVILSGGFFIYRYESVSDASGTQVSMIMDSISRNGYSFFVPAANSLDFSSNIFGYSLFSLVQAMQYIGHGVFEFAYIFEDFSDKGLCLAAFLPQIGFQSSCVASLDRIGVYYSLAGSEYIAFGSWSIFVMFFSGVWLGFCYSRSANVSLGARNLVLFAIFISPYVNSLGGYDIWLYLCAIVIGSFFRVRESGYFTSSRPSGV